MTDLVALHVRELLDGAARARRVSGPGVREHRVCVGVVRWHDHAPERGEVVPRSLTAILRVDPWHNPARPTEELWLRSELTPRGWCRWWLVCPGCGLPGARLYLTPGGSPHCRRCCGLAYPSQRKSRRGRALLRAEKLGRRVLGEWDGGPVLPPRPAWMWHRTYAKLAAVHAALTVAATRSAAQAPIRQRR